MIAAASIASAMPTAADPLPTLQDATARRIAYSALEGWAKDDHLAAWKVFERHCAALAAGAAALREGARPPEALRAVCRKAMAAKVNDATGARLFLERWFDPVEITPASGAAS